MCNVSDRKLGGLVVMIEIRYFACYMCMGHIYLLSCVEDGNFDIRKSLS